MTLRLLATSLLFIGMIIIFSNVEVTGDPLEAARESGMFVI